MWKRTWELVPHASTPQLLTAPSLVLGNALYWNSKLGKDDREIRDLQIPIPPSSNLPVPFKETVYLDVSIKNHGYVKRQTPLWTTWQSFHFTRHLPFIINTGSYTGMILVSFLIICPVPIVNDLNPGNIL